MTSARFLKEIADEVVIGVAMIFQRSLHQANIPDEWWKEIVTPIFKGGNKDCTKAENYTPFTLTSKTCKVLENVIHRNIISHVDQQKCWHMFKMNFIKSMAWNRTD